MLRARRSPGWGRRSASPAASSSSITATIELGSIPVCSCSCCWLSPGCAAISVITPKSRGCSPFSLTAAANRRRDASPLLPGVPLPAGKAVSSPGVDAQLAGVEAEVRKVIPGVRVAGYAGTHDPSFLSRDGRTTFIVAYPPPEPNESFGNNPEAAKHLTRPLRTITVEGAPVHVTGCDALSVPSGGGGGPGGLLEALLGCVGGLFLLAFVFGSLLAL